MTTTTTRDRHTPTAGPVDFTEQGLDVHVWKHEGNLYYQTTLRGELPDPHGTWQGRFVGPSALVTALRRELENE